MEMQSLLTKASAELVKRGLEIRRLKKDLAKYKRAYAEICHQFNFGDEDDYKRMYDTWLEWATEKETNNG